MFEQSLKCNFPKCKVAVTGEASVTRCSHIFCKNHLIRSDSISIKCPACSAILEGNYDIKQTNVNPSEEFKSFILTGYSPEMIFEVMSKGLQFWAFQLHMQNMYQASGVEHLRARLAQKESILETMELNIKHYIQMHEQKVKHLKSEVDKLTNAEKELEDQLYEKNRQLFNLQTRYEGLRRQSVASIITKDTEPMDTEGLIFPERRTMIEREPAPPTPSFLFCPNTSPRALHSTSALACMIGNSSQTPPNPNFVLLPNTPFSVGQAASHQTPPVGNVLQTLF